MGKSTEATRRRALEATVEERIANAERQLAAAIEYDPQIETTIALIAQIRLLTMAAESIAATLKRGTPP